MPRAKIVLTENGQGVEIELESADEPLGVVMEKALKLVSSLGDWLDDKNTN